ncbi:hypothetical protein EXT46_05300 [Pseudoalteromonas sp. CO325X]|uniref:hypothetical protein n=1 Tax=Pseudoalteromonas sp. CO325X TaxID=1777262 RepID=UPI0010235E87|nr:hypothetical protein [Pseudoalteromonas sp. CO325X]RZF83710.1 hypothetical protein EXT46_05300 [Pseudoalteromonas sp. CO325X]
MMRDLNEFVLAGINAGAYGSGQALDAAAAVPVYDIDYNPEIKTEAIQEALGYAGGNLEQSIEVYQAIKFKTLVRPAGDGNVDVPTINDVLWRLCGSAVTVTAAQDVVYSLVDENFEHGDIYYYVGEVLHKLSGVRGEFTFVHNIGALPYCEFTFYGLDEAVSEASAPAVDWSALTTPVPTTAATVSACTLLGQAVDYTTLTITPGNKFSYLHVSGNESIEFETREGMIDIKVAEPKPSVYNFWEAVKKGTEGPFAFQRGTDVDDAGKIFATDIPNVQLNGVSRSKDAGRLFLSLKAKIRPTARNNDLTWTTR